MLRSLSKSMLAAVATSAAVYGWPYFSNSLQEGGTLHWALEDLRDDLKNEEGGTMLRNMAAFGLLAIGAKSAVDRLWP